jgi:hypothetical protein
MVFLVGGSQNTAFGANTFPNLSLATTAGSFVAGQPYTIITIGTTDFTQIGAASNTIGLVFTATGPGAGTGAAAAQGIENNTALGYGTGGGIVYGINNAILGANVNGLAAGLSDAIILATGDGTIHADYNNTNAGAWAFGGPTVLNAYTIAQLLAIASPVEGMVAFVADTVAASAPTWRGTVAGGGSTTVQAPVFYTGSAWQYV